MTGHSEKPAAEVRLDVWLWAARFFKTRSLAKQAVEGGKVEVNDAACKAARSLRVDDRVRITRGEQRMEVCVLALSSRRGPASEAQLLFRETEASREVRESEREQRRLSGAAFDHPARRPDKHARKLLREIKSLQ
ncbi:MAG TPA: RNA-binding S4 domain-containing protein [Rhodanobacter sp.]|nr:RNA-binding S4 domain-containing protein [Rhodanobacter sp.]